MSDAGAWPSTQVTLLVRIRDAGNASAWTTFVELYTPVIYRYCRVRGLQDADARDVTQEVLTRVVRAIRAFEYDPGRGRFRSWLGTLVRHAVGDAWRRQQRTARDRPEGDLADLEAEADALWTDEFNAQVFQCALDRVRVEFDAETWSAFEAVWLNDRPSQEVARELGRPAGWVYKAKFRVIRRLKEEIQYLAADIPALVR